MRQFQGERLNLEFQRINRLLCLLGQIKLKCLNQVDHLLFGGRIEVKLIWLRQ